MACRNPLTIIRVPPKKTNHRQLGDVTRSGNGWKAKIESPAVDNGGHNYPHVTNVPSFFENYGIWSIVPITECAHTIQEYRILVRPHDGTQYASG